jgi:hypothetical protein
VAFNIGFKNNSHDGLNIQPTINATMISIMSAFSNILKKCDYIAQGKAHKGMADNFLKVIFHVSP